MCAGEVPKGVCSSGRRQECLRVRYVREKDGKAVSVWVSPRVGSVGETERWCQGVRACAAEARRAWTRPPGRPQGIASAWGGISTCGHHWKTGKYVGGAVGTRGPKGVVGREGMHFLRSQARKRIG